MTGYGRGETVSGGRHIVCEIKSVNHKYLEFGARLPRSYGFLEERLKGLVQSHLARGKVDVFLQIETLSEADVQVSVNHALAEGYVRALRELKETYALPDEVGLALLARTPDLFSVRKAPEDEEAVWQAVREAAEAALGSLCAMREAEGARLQKDLLEKAGNIEAMVDRVEEITPQTVREYRERLEAKIRELLEGESLDEQRVLTEVAVFADKVAVDEETVRLRSHVRQFCSLAQKPEPAGRKLDFLIQEMNREVNTIGSKSQNAQIAYLVVDLKSEIEKLREQVQNIE